MPTTEYDSRHFPNIQAAQRAMEEDAAEDARQQREADRRQREYELRAGRESNRVCWRDRRARLESLIEVARSTIPQAKETVRQAVNVDDLEAAVTAAIQIGAAGHVLEIAEAELAAHLENEPAPS